MGKWSRRSFLKAVAIAAGAVATTAYTGIDIVAKSTGLRKPLGIPTWTAIYKQFGTRGHITGEMHIPEGRFPPQDKQWAGIPWQLYKYDVGRQRAWYYRKES